MKQILVITRIDTNQPEFSVLFPEETMSVTEEYADYSLIVYDGSKIYAYDEDEEEDDINEMATKIVNLVDKEASEVLIVVHYSSSNFRALSNALLKSKNMPNCRVVQYSATDPNYVTEIRPALQEVVSDNKVIEKIYKLFAYDPILEAKLNLLHSCLLPSTILPLDEILSEYQSYYDKFIASVEGVNWDNRTYVASLTELRDALLGT